MRVLDKHQHRGITIYGILSTKLNNIYKKFDVLNINLQLRTYDYLTI